MHLIMKKKSYNLDIYQNYMNAIVDVSLRKRFEKETSKDVKK